MKHMPDQELNRMLVDTQSSMIELRREVRSRKKKAEAEVNLELQTQEAKERKEFSMEEADKNIPDAMLKQMGFSLYFDLDYAGYRTWPMAALRIGENAWLHYHRRDGAIHIMNLSSYKKEHQKVFLPRIYKTKEDMQALLAILHADTFLSAQA